MPRYLNNTIWVLIEKFFRLIASLFIGIMVTRFLGPEKFGLLSYAVGVASIFASFSSLGFDITLVKRFSSYCSDENEIIGTALVLRFLSTLLSTLILIIVMLTLNKSDELMTIFILIGAASFLNSFNVIDLIFQAKVKSIYVVRIFIVQIVASSSLRLVLIYYGSSVEMFASVLVLEAVIYSTGLIFSYRAYITNNIKWKFRNSTARKLLVEGLPYIFSGLAISIYLKIDVIMIQEMIDSEAVGIYSAANRLTEASYFIPTAIIGSLFPLLVRLRNQSSEEFYEAMSAISGGLVVLAVSLALIISTFGEHIILLLYGEDFLLSAQVLAIHTWAAIFVFLGMISHRWYVIEMKPTLALRRSMEGLLINMVLNYFLIPIYGIAGAATATLLGHMYVGFISDFLYPSTRKLFYTKLAGVVSFLALLFKYMDAKIEK